MVKSMLIAFHVHRPCFESDVCVFAAVKEENFHFLREAKALLAKKNNNASYICF